MSVSNITILYVGAFTNEWNQSTEYRARQSRRFIFLRIETLPVDWQKSPPLLIILVTGVYGLSFTDWNGHLFLTGFDGESIVSASAFCATNLRNEGRSNFDCSISKCSYLVGVEHSATAWYDINKYNTHPLDWEFWQESSINNKQVINGETSKSARFKNRSR